MEHLAVPFRIRRDGSAATVVQDSTVEIAQSVRVLLATRPGDRQVVPRYGIDDLTFVGPTEVTGEWVADAIDEWEPRADLDIVVDQIDDVGRVPVTVEVS